MPLSERPNPQVQYLRFEGTLDDVINLIWLYNWDESDFTWGNLAGVIEGLMTLVSIYRSQFEFEVYEKTNGWFSSSKRLLGKRGTRGRHMVEYLFR